MRYAGTGLLGVMYSIFSKVFSLFLQCSNCGSLLLYGNLSLMTLPVYVFPIFCTSVKSYYYAVEWGIIYFISVIIKHIFKILNQGERCI